MRAPATAGILATAARRTRVQPVWRPARPLAGPHGDDHRMDSTRARADRLLAARPFAQLDLREIAPIPGASVHSGGAFFATAADGRRYKLRECSHRLRALAIARWVRLLPSVFPKLVGREGRLLLLERLDDFRPMTRTELLAHADDLGRIGARVHGASPSGLSGAIGRRAAALRFDARFRSDLRAIAATGLVDAPTHARALAKYQAHHGRFGMPVALELDDLHKGNWMLRESDGAMRYVDEEGVGLRPKGTGLASLLKTVTRTNPWYRYKLGYSEYADAEFLSWPYTEYLLLIDTVRRVAHKARTEAREEKLPDEVAHLRAMAATPELALDWRFPKGDT